MTRRLLSQPIVVSGLAALALTAVLYYDALALPLFADDLVQIPWLESASWREIWSSPSPYGYYRPVWYSLWRVWGTATGGLRPLSLHALNLVAHVAAAWLVGILAWSWLDCERRARLDEMSAARSASGGDNCAAALISTVVFAVFPFARQAVAWPGAVYNPLVSAMAAAAVLSYDRGRRRERWGWIALSAALAAAAAFTYEGGLMVAPLIIALEGVGWLGRRWRRRLSAWPLLFAFLAGACAVTWQAGRGTSIGGFGLRATDLAQNVTYLIQGLTYPSAPLAQPLASRTAVAPELSLWLLALPTLAALVWCGMRSSPSLLLLGLAWFGLFAAPPIVSMEADWFAFAPRFLYTTAPGIALAWTPALALAFGRPRGRVTDRPTWAAIAALVAAIGLLAPAVVFVRRGMDLYVMAGEAIWEAARAGAVSPPALLVNLPHRLTPTRRVYPLGFEGITPLPQRVTAAELVYVHTGATDAAEAIAFGIAAPSAPPRYAYELFGRETGWVEVADASRRATAVHIAHYYENEIRVIEAGGRAQGGPIEEMDAIFEGTIGLRDPSTVCDDLGQVQLAAVWEALTPVGTDVAIYAHLIEHRAKTDKPAAQADGYPLLGMRPFWLFQEGEAVRDVRYFPPVPAGLYDLRLGLFEPASGRRWALDTPARSDSFILQVLCQ